MAKCLLQTHVLWIAHFFPVGKLHKVQIMNKRRVNKHGIRKRVALDDSKNLHLNFPAPGA